MPSSCLVPSVAEQSVSDHVAREVTGDVLGDFGAVRAACGALAGYLDQVVDHRSRQGLRYELGYVLAVVVAATACAGHDEVAAAGPVGRGRAGRGTGSAGATPARQGESERLAGVAIDGKSVRGAATGGHPRPHLLAAVTHDGSIVLAQRPIPDKSSESSELAALVCEVDLAGTVLTVDALHPQRATAEHLVSVKGAEDIMTIKANQPGLLAAAQHALSGPATDFADYTEQ